jgi:hypothetical protein
MLEASGALANLSKLMLDDTILEGGFVLISLREGGCGGGKRDLMLRMVISESVDSYDRQRFYNGLPFELLYPLVLLRSSLYISWLSILPDK